MSPILIPLQISGKSLPLHRVFHSIRFKVNKGLEFSGTPFFMSVCEQKKIPDLSIRFAQARNFYFPSKAIFTSGRW